MGKHGLDNGIVTVKDGHHRETKTKYVHASYIGDVTNVLGQVVKGAVGLKTFWDVAAPAKDGWSCPGPGPDPHKQDAQQGPPFGHAVGGLQGLGDDIVAVYGNHGQGVDGQKPEHPSKPAIDGTPCQSRSHKSVV